MRTVLFLSDTFNRRFMKLYNESGLRLPNVERLAERSAVFDNHWTGSAPCMPARRDIMTGRINFLERHWGPIEAFDHTLPQMLRNAGTPSRIVTDHYHYLEIGGENYVQMFDSWEMIRGQEWDPWVSRLRDKPIPEHRGKMVPQYWYNRDRFKDDESAYPSARVAGEAANWLEENRDRDDFFLWVEPFDPHEPFEVPEKYLKMLNDDYDGVLYMWPEYKRVDVGEKELRHVRNRHMALMLMTDHWLGRILDVLDRHDMWKDTAFIFTTDHGYMLGEHGYLAKNYMPAYNEVFHIPLVVHLPGNEGAGRRVGALTQNIDILPTIAELHDAPVSARLNPIHGKSWLPLIHGNAEAIREYALYGYFGKQANITDGRFTYFHSPNGNNRPLNIYTTIPTDIREYFGPDRLKDPDSITIGRHLSWTRYPVYRIPADAFTANDDGTLRYVWLNEWDCEDRLFDLEKDYGQDDNIVNRDTVSRNRMREALREVLAGHDAPKEQFERLRLE
jgi:arylsulfatase A-like enzyme